MPFPFRIIQTPKQISILYEWGHAVRNIFMDSEHPAGPIEWWMGDSRGRWEGDTLVVDVVVDLALATLQRVMGSVKAQPAQGSIMVTDPDGIRIQLMMVV